MQPNDPNQPPPPSGIYNAPPTPDAGYQGYVNPTDSQYIGVDPNVITQFMQPEKLTDAMIKSQQTKSKVASLAVAALVHVLLIALLAVVVVQVVQEDPPELTIAATQSSTDNAIEKKEFVNNVKQKPSRPSAKPSNLIVSNVASPVSVPTLDIDVDSPSIGNSFGAGFGNGGFGDGGGGGLSVPSVMKGRCDAADRSKRLRESGGEMKMDRSVLAALRYLKGKQNKNGSWGTVYPVAMTGLSLLAYCGHCETVDSPEFGKTVTDAIGYLVEKADGADGMMMSTNGRTLSYEHAIAVYALGEAYSLNKNSRKPFAKISPVIKKGAKIVIDGQTNAGGWLYSYGKNGVGDLSVSGWNVQALKAAELTGLNVSGLGTAKKKALKYLEDTATNDGKFRYMVNDQHKEGKDTLIGVGILCSRMLEGLAKHEDEGFKLMLAQNPKAMNVYAWYYNSQAAFQRGGPIWDDYNKSFQQEVLNSQKEDGSWGGDAGNGEVGADTPIYVTSLCTLMMEVYYRYLPATDNKKKGPESGLMKRD
jgi:hypothetical protein